jgi:hypothetical protein
MTRLVWLLAIIPAAGALALLACQGGSPAARESSRTHGVIPMPSATHDDGTVVSLDRTPNDHVELGAVKWRRGFDAAREIARRENKSVVILFQEVPG